MLKFLFKLITLIVGGMTLIIIAFNFSHQSKTTTRPSIEKNWSNIDLTFKSNPALIDNWLNLGFTFEKEKIKQKLGKKRKKNK